VRSSEAVAVRKSFSFRSLMMRVMLVMMMVVGGKVAWGQVVSGRTYETKVPNSMPTGWTTNASTQSNNYLMLTTDSKYIQTCEFCQNGFTRIVLKARKYGGPSNAQALITVSWYDATTSAEKVLGTITPTSTSLSNYTISSPSNPTANTNGYIKIQCKGASSGKGSGVSEVTITYTSGSCGTTPHTLSSAIYPVGSGFVSLGSTSLATGATTTATATPNTGYAFDHWSISGTGASLSSASTNTTTVTMGTANATITANFVAVPTSYTVSFNAGSGFCGTSSLTTSSSIELPSANAIAECDGIYTFYGWSTSPVAETYSTPEIVGTTGDTYSPTGNIALYAVYKKDKGTYSEKTYNFSEIPGFSGWDNTYIEHIVNYDVADVIFASANHQTNTINDIPVTKGNDVSVIMRDVDRHIKEASFVCRQWTNKEQTITLHYSINRGTSYSTTGTTSTNFSISNSNLNANTNAVRITFSSTSNQVGIESCKLKVSDVIYNTNPSCTRVSLIYNANGAESGDVPVDSDSPYLIDESVTVLGNTGNLAKYGYSFDGWNAAADGSGVSYSAGTTFTITENTTLYAQWTPNDYYVTWWANGLALEGMDYTYGDYIPEGDIYDEDAEDYACEGKHFVGWSVTEFEETDDFPAMTTRDQIARTPVSGEKIYYAVFANVDANDAQLNTILWSETWNGGSAGTNPSDYDFSGTNVYGGAILTYAQSDDNSILYSQNLAGGASPELLLSKSNKTWTISNIPTGGAKEMSFTFKSNKIDFELTTTTENIDISGSEASWIITAAENVTNFNLTLKNTGSSNARIDDIELKVTKINGTGYTTFCPCAYDIDGISNGDMVWAGKNGPTNEWNYKSNWVVYNSSDSKYHLAANVPTESSNVFIINKRTECNINVKPLLTSNVTCNNITLSNNMGINLDEYNLTVTGDLTNDGSEITGTGKVIFAGTATQTISGATTFGNVEFNNSNGITASTEPTINGAATFTNGIINGKVTFGSNATISGVSTSSHVNGVVTKSGTANGFTFPTGSNGNLGKVEVTDGSATDVSVQYFSNPAGFGANDLPRWWNAADMSGENPFNHVSNVEYWRISSTEAITANFVAEASTDMHFNSETEDEDKIPTNIQMAFYDNNRWTNVGGSASIEGNTLSITDAEIPASATRGISGNYTTFGSKSKSSVLPIELVSFTANCNGRSALIEWTTATEKNNDFFVLERSNDAVNFKEIARIAGAGNSIEPISYAYTDYGARNGDNYYRLVQVDYDGTSTTSEIIVANCLGTDGEPEVLAYPNPFGDDLTLRFESFGNIQATVEVYDMLGRMVHTQKVNCSQNDYEVVLRLAGLSDGTYNVRISTADFVINRKVVKE
jgi:uncharacterized repeat protein (TIGR02543 family)